MMVGLSVSWFLLMFLSGITSGYKIRRTICNIEDGEDVMYCTCGGFGDPFAIIMNKGPNPRMGLPFYGTRYGHNYGAQIKQCLINSNRTDEQGPPLRKVVYQDCLDHPFRVKLDFSEFSGPDKSNNVDISTIEELEFNNLHSVNMYMYKQLDWGNLTVSFNNVLNVSQFDEDEEGSVIIKGKVTYCKNPCQVGDTREKSKVDEDSMKYCTPCSSNSHLIINLNNVSELLLDEMLFPEDKYGLAYIFTNNITVFRVKGGVYNGVKTKPIAEKCTAYDEITNCSLVIDHGSGLPLENEWTGIAVAAVAVIIVFMFVVGVLITSRPKPI